MSHSKQNINSRNISNMNCMHFIRRNIIIFIFSLILFSTIFIQSSYLESGYIEAKHHYFCIASALLIIMGCATFIYKHESQIVVYFNALDIIFCTYIFYLFLNNFLNNLYTNNFTFSIFITLPIYIFLKLLYRKGIEAIICIIYVFLLINIVECFIGINQLFNIFLDQGPANIRIQGSFFNPGIYAIAISSSLILCITMLLFDEHLVVRYKFLKLMLSLSIIFSIIILPATQSRTACIAVLAYSALLYFFKNNLFFKSYTIKILSIILLMLCIAFIVLTLYNFRTSSVDGRFLIWKISFKMISERLFTGFGHNSFSNTYTYYQSVYFQKNRFTLNELLIADKNDFALNDYLQVLIESGILGLILLLSTITYIFLHIIRTFKDKPPLLLASGSVVILIAICGLSSYPLQVLPTWILFSAFIFIFSTCITNKKTHYYKFYLTKNRVSTILFSLILCFCSIGVIRKELILISSEHNYALAKNISKSDRTHSLFLYKNAYPTLRKNPYFLMDYGKCLLSCGKIHEAQLILLGAASISTDPILYCNIANIYSQNNEFKAAETYYIQSISMIPNRLYPRYLLAQMYIKANDSLAAYLVAKRIMLLPDKVSSPATREIRRNMHTLLKYEKTH